MKPSVGRIVIFTEPELYSAVLGSPREYAAIITSVVDQNHVNLTVFRDGSETYFRAVPSVEVADSLTIAGTWRWPERV